MLEKHFSRNISVLKYIYFFFLLLNVSCENCDTIPYKVFWIKSKNQSAEIITENTLLLCQNQGCQSISIFNYGNAYINNELVKLILLTNASK